ncbi:MAG TPA: hypothetical protein DDW65_21000, partial [Firmicutes bacterium]|nr:hypothetical protein [Bacillota bacterium]
MKTKIEEHKKPILTGSIVLGIILIAGLGGLYYWISTFRYVYTDDASIDGDHVSVSAKMLGRIQKLEVDEGANVEEGQLLAELDDADLRAQENQSNTGLVSAKENVILKRVDLQKAQEDFERAAIQFKSGFISKEEYDHAKNAFDSAQVQNSIAASQVSNTQAQLGVIQTQLGSTKIFAPISGTIAKRSVMPGEVVQPGQVIFLINDLKHVWVTANFEETKIRLVHPDQSAEVDV